jgi:hypothetical protein
MALPIGFGALAASVLAYGCRRPQQLNAGAVGLGLAGLGAVAMRLVITSHAFHLVLKEVTRGIAHGSPHGLAKPPRVRAGARAQHVPLRAVDRWCPRSMTWTA